jgi:hypothetical protein
MLANTGYLLETARLLGDDVDCVGIEVFDDFIGDGFADARKDSAAEVSKDFLRGYGELCNETGDFES